MTFRNFHIARALGVGLALALNLLGLGARQAPWVERLHLGKIDVGQGQTKTGKHVWSFVKCKIPTEDVLLSNVWLGLVALGIYDGDNPSLETCQAITMHSSICGNECAHAWCDADMNAFLDMLGLPSLYDCRGIWWTERLASMRGMPGQPVLNQACNPVPLFHCRFFTSSRSEP